mmetsp:Transcript_66959/g.131992  ORF Transcript_66959/g.131992 Transcript_66959/m.131992 type:complete len:237 (-) Transcript_66959:798-1508(-)
MGQAKFGAGAAASGQGDFTAVRSAVADASPHGSGTAADSATTPGPMPLEGSAAAAAAATAKAGEFGTSHEPAAPAVGGGAGLVEDARGVAGELGTGHPVTLLLAGGTPGALLLEGHSGPGPLLNEACSTADADALGGDPVASTAVAAVGWSHIGVNACDCGEVPGARAEAAGSAGDVNGVALFGLGDTPGLVAGHESRPEFCLTIVAGSAVAPAHHGDFADVAALDAGQAPAVGAL